MGEIFMDQPQIRQTEPKVHPRGHSGIASICDDSQRIHQRRQNSLDDKRILGTKHGERSNFQTQCRNGALERKHKQSFE